MKQTSKEEEGIRNLSVVDGEAETRPASHSSFSMELEMIGSPNWEGFGLITSPTYYQGLEPGRGNEI